MMTVSTVERTRTRLVSAPSRATYVAFLTSRSLLMSARKGDLRTCRSRRIGSFQYDAKEKDSCGWAGPGGVRGE